MNYAGAVLTIIYRLFLETENSLATGVAGHTVTMRARLSDGPSRPAKGRLSSDGTLGTMSTDSPLEYVSVLSLQPACGVFC